MGESPLYVLRRKNFPGEIIIRNRNQSFTCGRGKDNEVICPSMFVSRRHCIFIVHSDGLYIRDLQSSNGVFVNGVKKLRDTKINPNDIVGIGISDTNPEHKDFFVYRLQAQQNNNEEPIQRAPEEGAVVPNIPIKVENDNEIVPAQKPQSCFPFKRPASSNGNLPPKKLMKMKVKESCSDVIERTSERNSGISVINNNVP